MRDSGSMHQQIVRAFVGQRDLQEYGDAFNGHEDAKFHLKHQRNPGAVKRREDL